jgi:hypothetical protein
MSIRGSYRQVGLPKTPRYCWPTPKYQNWCAQHASFEGKKLRKRPQEKVRLERCRRLANSIRPFVDIGGLIRSGRDSCRAWLTSDFSVVLFRPNFMLASEEHPMKVHKNQRLLTILSPPDIPCGATNQGTHHGVWGADTFAVT